MDSAKKKKRYITQENIYINIGKSKIEKVRKKIKYNKIKNKIRRKCAMK